MSRKVRAVRDVCTAEGYSHDGLELQQGEIIIVLSEPSSLHCQAFGRKLITGEEGYFNLQNCEPINDSEPVDTCHANVPLITRGSSYESVTKCDEGDDGCPTPPLKKRKLKRRKKCYYTCWTFVVVVEIILTSIGLAINNLGFAYKSTKDSYSLKCTFTDTVIGYYDTSGEWTKLDTLSMEKGDNSTQLCSSNDIGFCWNLSALQLKSLDAAGAMIFIMAIFALALFLLAFIIRCCCKRYSRHSCWANSCVSLGWVAKVAGVLGWILTMDYCYAVGFNPGIDSENESYIAGHSMTFGITVILLLPSLIPFTILILALRQCCRMHSRAELEAFNDCLDGINSCLDTCNSCEPLCSCHHCDCGCHCGNLCCTDCFRCDFGGCGGLDCGECAGLACHCGGC